MKFGAIVQQGTPAQIVLNPETDYVADFVKDLPKVKFITANDIHVDPKKWLVRPDDSVSQIMKRMESEDLWYAFITGEDQRVQGVVDYHQMATHEKKDAPPSRNKTDTNFPTVRQDTFLEQLIAVGASSPVPIVVLDIRQRVVGLIPRERLLEAISTQ